MKFNKDTFLNDVTNKVQSAISKAVITHEDAEHNDEEKLHRFIQYLLLEYIEDRKFAIDVLKDFNYDDRTPWNELEDQFGKFESLQDIALVNLWKYLAQCKATSYTYYNFDEYAPDKQMLDVVHDMNDTDEVSPEFPSQRAARNDMTDNGDEDAPKVKFPRRRFIHRNEDEYPEDEN